jgi:hypothetical protein
MRTSVFLLHAKLVLTYRMRDPVKFLYLYETLNMISKCKEEIYSKKYDLLYFKHSILRTFTAFFFFFFFSSLRDSFP